MSEIRRVLPKNGFAILQVPISKTLKKLMKIFQLFPQEKEKNILGRRITLEFTTEITQRD